MIPLVEALRISFASEYAFYLKAHSFHWNVEGADFAQYHELFGSIYEEVFGALDPFAENIRKIDAYAPGSFSMLSKYSLIEEVNNVMSATEMCGILLSDCEKLQKIHAKVYQMADQAGFYGLSNFLAERQDAQAKHAWMLRSSLK
jgi:starvation-inducible DNA-binding protein